MRDSVRVKEIVCVRRCVGVCASVYINDGSD